MCRPQRYHFLTVGTRPKTGNIHCATASSPSAMPQLPRGGRTNFSGQISGPTPASWAGSLRDATSPECPAHPDNARECILPASTSAKAGLAATPARTSGEQTAYVFPRKALPAGAKSVLLCRNPYPFCHESILPPLAYTGHRLHRDRFGMLRARKNESTSRNGGLHTRRTSYSTRRH